MQIKNLKFLIKITASFEQSNLNTSKQKATKIAFTASVKKYLKLLQTYSVIEERI